ncbi:kinase-like domain-containing protein [Choanephora cucurbitarum]|nr:kinase-like domain-containing protein [Choanephora cucurbitarum]
MSESIGSNMVHSNSSGTHQSKASPYISEHELEDRMAESASSNNAIDPTTALERHPDMSSPTQQPQETESSVEVSSSDTSSINPSAQHQQAWHEIKSIQRTSSDKYMPKGVVGNEDLCRRKFAKMVLAANKFQLAQPQDDKPTEMVLLFDSKGNIDMMRMTRHGKTELHKFVGNSQYVPPELFNNNAKYQSELGDIWVLGIFLYRMLVGKYPFTASNDQQLFKKMLHCDFSIPNHLSDDVKDIIRHMLAPDSTRASLDLIIYHPWIEPYRHLLLDHYTHSAAAASDHNNTHTNTINNNNNADNNNNSIRQEQPQQKRSKSARFSTSSSTTVQEKAKKTRRSSRTKRLLQNALRLIFQGPFPPPRSPYQDLAHLGTRGSAFARHKQQA